MKTFCIYNVMLYSSVRIIVMYKLLKANMPKQLLLCVRKPKAFYVTSQHNKSRFLHVIIL